MTSFLASTHLLALYSSIIVQNCSQPILSTVFCNFQNCWSFSGILGSLFSRFYNNQKVIPFSFLVLFIPSITLMHFSIFSVRSCSTPYSTQCNPTFLTVSSFSSSLLSTVPFIQQHKPGTWDRYLSHLSCL